MIDCAPIDADGHSPLPR